MVIGNGSEFTFILGEFPRDHTVGRKANDGVEGVLWLRNFFVLVEGRDTEVSLEKFPFVELEAQPSSTQDSVSQTQQFVELQLRKYFVAEPLVDFVIVAQVSKACMVARHIERTCNIVTAENEVDMPQRFGFKLKARRCMEMPTGDSIGFLVGKANTCIARHAHAVRLNALRFNIDQLSTCLKRTKKQETEQVFHGLRCPAKIRKSARVRSWRNILHKKETRG